MESNTNNISYAGLHGLDQRQRRSETSEEVDIRQGQNALGSLIVAVYRFDAEPQSRGARLWLVYNRPLKYIGLRSMTAKRFILV